ncbi:MAG: hypothetical protein HY674_20010 [Chloroflexi bacterium]|nr:hypothetical protein [Chloroflexota bacterium]
MPKKRTQAIIAAGLFMAAALPALPSENPPGLEPLQGKWSVTKTNQDGNRYSQLIEIKKDQLTFRIIDQDERVRLFAKGTVKVEKAGPFEALILSNIQGGRSEEELEPVDDDRASVYALRDGKLILAVNFDRDRDNERPSIDTYARLAAAKETTPVPGEGESQLLGNWKVDVSLGENSYDYVLRISKADGKLAATMVSPRSGDHKCKSATFDNGELVMELDREIQGNAVTFVYQAKLAGEGLSGTVVVKGREDQFSGRWKASK